MADLDPRKEKKLDLTTEVVKQQITLSTAIIGGALAFSDQITAARAELPGALVAFVLCILFGVLTLMTTAGHVDRTDDPASAPMVRVFGVLMSLAFLVAVSWTVVAIL